MSDDLKLGGYKVTVEVTDPEGEVIGSILLVGSDPAKHDKLPLPEGYSANMEVGGIFRGPDSPERVAGFFEAIAMSVATTARLMSEVIRERHR